jgi:hypothetical protein
MRQLATKYEDEPSFPACYERLANCVFLRFAAESHDLSLVAHAFTAQSKLSSLDAVEPSQENMLFLDQVSEDIRNEEKESSLHSIAIWWKASFDRQNMSLKRSGGWTQSVESILSART